MESTNEMKQNLLLADDDIDDCMFFKEALTDLDLPVALVAVNDGVELMEFLLKKTDDLPDVLFLDLNMPRKSGFECLSEIKLNEKLKQLPVIILSTSLDLEVANLLYDNGAHYFIRKPGEFAVLKKVIHDALIIVSQNKSKQPSREQFILQSSL